MERNTKYNEDELKAAVSASPRRREIAQYSYSDDFREAEEENLRVLRSRQKKASTFQARNIPTNVNDDELFDERSKRSRKKKVSFLETYTIHSHLEDVKASDSHKYDAVDPSIYQRDKWTNSLQTSSDNDDADRTYRNGNCASADPQMATLDTSRSSLDHKEVKIIHLPLDFSEMEPPGPKEKISLALKGSCQLSAPDLRELSLADSFRKRLKTEEDAETENFSIPQTSSTSIPLYTDTSSDCAWAEEERVNSGNSPSNKSEESQLRGHCLRILHLNLENFVSDNQSKPDSKKAEAFEENLHSVGQLDQPSNTDAKTFDTRKSGFHLKNPQKSQRLFYKKVESKYLGTCKILDRKVSLNGSQPQTAETLRAVVYQKWLQEKKEATKETMLLKKKEELTEDKKKKKEEDQKKAAAAAYEAWKKQKAHSLEVKAREKKEKMRKEQREIQEKEKRRQSANEVYDKWKIEHDKNLKVKLRKQREVERKCQLEKKENEEHQKRDSKYAFSSWSEKKKNVNERLKKEHKPLKSKVEEERYKKEDKDKMAIEAFENWLTRKSLKKEKRRRNANRPWNPPNKTITHQK